MNRALIIGVSAFVILMIHSMGMAAGSKEQFSSRVQMEESGNMAFPTDQIVVGELKEFSNVGMIVGGFFNSFCSAVKVYGRKGLPLTLEDLGNAAEVKLFINQTGCVRKVNILKTIE